MSGRALASYGRHLRLERYMLANGITLLSNAGLSLLHLLVRIRSKQVRKFLGCQMLAKKPHSGE